MRVCPYCHLVLALDESVCPRDGEKGEETDITIIPASLGERFESIEPCARGETGVSFTAVQSASGYKGLLKILTLTAGADGSERMRLKRELRKQTTLTNNALVRIIDGGEVDQDLWLFRDWAEGESLKVHLLREGPLKVPDALGVTAQIATALDELHRSGLLHRDLKPGHVILNKREDAVPLVAVIDAGIAASLESGSMFDLLGTPAYMSPEQADGKLVSFRSDLYALGCLMYEMLTGAPPFTGEDTKAVLAAHKEQPAPKPDVELPTAVASLLDKLLAKEPRKRPFSAQQVRRTLEPFLPETTPPARSATQTSVGNMNAPVVASGSKPPPVPGVVGFPAREDQTEEIQLEDVRIEDFGTSEPNETLSTQEFEALDISLDDEPAGVTDEDADSQTGPEAHINTGQAADETAAPEQEPAADEAEPQVDSPAEADDAAPGRPSVNFDVESLFDDSVPEDLDVVEQPGAMASTSQPTSSPPPPPSGAADDDDNKATLLYRPPSPEQGALADSDPDGTMLLVKRPSWQQKPFLLAAGGALLLLVLVMVFSGSDAEEDALPDTAEATHSGDDGDRTTATGASEQSATGENKPADDETAVAAAPGDSNDQGAGAAEDQGPAGDEPEQAPAGAQQDEGAETSSGESAGSERAATEQKAAKRGGDGAAAPAAKKSFHAQGSRTKRVSKSTDYKAQALKLYKAKKYREAATAYQKATRQTPSDAGAFAGLGASRLASGDAAGAITAYQRAVRLKPRSSGFHAALGRAYAKRGDQGRAKAAYKRALKLNPKNRAAEVALERM